MHAILALLIACQPKESAPRACNGAEALCDRPFDQVSLPGTHNSMSNADDGWSIPNQQHDIPTQLQDGVRGLMIDTYDEDGELLTCHGDCDLGSAPLVEVLGEIQGFLAENPNEVLAIIFQDGITPEQTAAAFADSGLDASVYAWDGGDWPTLGAMIDADTRLVVGAESAGPPPDWYHHAWDLWWDTPYDFSSVEEFSCELNRGALDNPLFLVNHWLGPISTSANGAEANAAEVLGARVAQCAEERGHLPNLVAVDHYDQGDLFAVVDALNGLD